MEKTDVMSKPGWSLCALLLLQACVGGVTPSGEQARPGGAGPSRPGQDPLPPPPSERPAAAAVNTTRFARLGHRQWENSVRDLLRLPSAPGLSAKFSTDATGTFANNGEALSVSDTLRIDYQTAAETLAQRVAQDPAALARIVPAGAPAGGPERALAFIRDFGRRAYRRPLDDQETMTFSALFEQGSALVPGVDGFAAGAQLVLEAMLQSPNFLYRTELVSGPGRQRLGDYEIAAKLSFAVVGSMPDDALFEAAAAGALGSYEQVAAQVERLLAQGDRSGLTFHEELFALAGLASDIDKDPQRFPEFKPTWLPSIQKESGLFLGEIFSAGGGLADLLTAPFTFVDATLASLYGVKRTAAAGDFQRVDLDTQQRAGFLTQIGFLARYGATEPDTILRGAFINQKLLCLNLAPPPGATESIMMPPASARTNRDRVTAITSPAACAACHHTVINPAGFAFEHYDALGRYRTTDNGEPINAADSYAFSSGARSFTNAIEWSQRLAESPEVHECYAGNWFTYLQGRSLRPEDEPFVKWLAGRSKGQRASLRSLVLTVVTDDSFLTRL
jgi:Protein of unknown function (DUF1592)/Protein of unknown function (DUF1588)/Protein of unknown function (DUF1595)/Protein of unknown function (DUF1585)/Protein of unknown function (DUF1587)